MPQSENNKYLYLYFGMKVNRLLNTYNYHNLLLNICQFVSFCRSFVPLEILSIGSFKNRVGFKQKNRWENTYNVLIHATAAATFAIKVCLCSQFEWESA